MVGRGHLGAAEPRPLASQAMSCKVQCRRMAHPVLWIFPESHYELQSCSKSLKAIPTNGPRKTAGRAPWFRGEQGRGKPSRHVWPEGKFPPGSKSGSLFIWACEQGVQGRHCCYRFGEEPHQWSHAGEAILPEGAELDPNCCFLSASWNIPVWLKPLL